MNQYVGKTLGAYQILEPIGKGGMATIFKAYQPSMDRYVAVKILAAHFTEDESFAARFTQEARTLARLEHPHVLPVHDYGEQGGITYLVMRYIEAGTLKDLVVEQGAMDLKEAARVFGQVGRALGYAHSQGVIHRDIKPTNVLIDDRGDAFLTDFGIAKLVAGSPQFTATGAIIGTPAYMSPEQGRGETVDHRSDIYSLGVVLYEMVTGTVPFEAETPLAVLLKHVNEPLPPPRQVKSDLPEVVERVILKAMAKNPDDRYQTAEDMVAALQKAVSGLAAVPARPSTLAKAEAPTVPPARPPAPASQPRRPAAYSLVQPNEGRSIPWLPIAGGVAALAVVVIVAIVLLSGGGGDEAQATATELGAVSRATEQATQAPTLPPTVPPTLEPTVEPTVPPTEAPTVPPTEAPTVPPTEAPRPTLPPPPLASGLPAGWTNYSNSNFVYALVRQGDYLWAGGSGGLVRWDLTDGGYEKFDMTDGLASNEITDLLVDDAGTLWVATDFGVSRYDGESWTSFGEEDGLDSHWVQTLFLDAEGALWAGTAYGDLGLNYYDGETWGPAPLPPLPVEWPKPQAMAQDSQGGLWVGLAEGKGLAYFDGEAWQLLTEENSDLPGSDVTDLLLVEDEVLLVSFDYAELTGIELDTGEVETLPEFDSIDVYDMYQAADGSLWFVGIGGAIRLDLETEDWQEFDANSRNIPAWAVYAITGDESGVWLGTDGGGIAFYDGSSWQNWTTEDGPAGNDVEAIVQDGDGALWFTHSGEGLSRYDPHEDVWQSFGDEEGANDWPPYPGVDGDGQVWIGDYGELLMYAGGTWRAFTPPQMADSIPYQITFDPSGAQWVLTGENLWRHDLEANQWTEFTVSDHPALSEVYQVHAAQDGSVWVEGEEALLRYDGTEWAVVQGSGEAPNYLSAMASEADGTLWLTSGDLYRLADDQWSRFRWPGDLWIEVLVPGPDGTVWVGGPDGLGRFDPADNSWQSFTTRDGLIHSSVQSLYVTPQGVVWIGTGNGISRFVPEE